MGIAIGKKDGGLPGDEEGKLPETGQDGEIVTWLRRFAYLLG
jgi:hypothetical protein